MSEKQPIIEQVRLRVSNEKICSYSVAINHLLNEIHAICYSQDHSTKKVDKDYDVNDVLRFLQMRSVPNYICVKIRNLFDRRNTNQVSHSGSINSSSWGVTSDEYSDYRRHVGKCLEFIL